MHDEAELRGHRRTYIGAMAGRIIQAIRRAGVNNPVLMLDEVDKLGRDFRGDPAAALLEILDPEQNKTFRDNYLDLPFDISKVFFVMTANTLETIPQPLLDRMEVVRLAGYSEEEKLEIARRYQIPKQLKEAGLSADICALSDDALRIVITRYTREAGVRQLERAIGRVMRKVALKMAEGESAASVEIKPEQTDRPARSRALLARTGAQDGTRRASPPVSPGPKPAATFSTSKPRCSKDGKGLSLTGQLGEVMQESAKIAQSYIWSHASEFHIDQSLFRRYGVHVHVPAGAHSEGRTLGRRHHDDRADLALHRSARSQRYRDDRRSYAFRPRAAGRRNKGEDAGRAPPRHPARHHSETKRKGSARSAGGRPQRNGVCPGRTRA